MGTGGYIIVHQALGQGKLKIAEQLLRLTIIGVQEVQVNIERWKIKIE